MVSTRARRAQQQQELEEKAQDALSWRKYYTQNSFRYNRGRLVKRIVAKKRVLLKTLKKYQLVQFYKENTTAPNKKYLKEEEQFLNALEKTPLNSYINETVNTVANDLKNMLVGNTHSPIINPDKIDVRVNVRCPTGGVEAQENNFIQGDIVDDDYQEDFNDGVEEAKTDDLDIDDDDDDDDDDDYDVEPLPPTPPPTAAKKKRKRAPKAKYVPFSLADGLNAIANGKLINGNPIAKSTIAGNQGNLRRLVELLNCGDDLVACLRKTRNMKMIQYKIVDGKKVLRENRNKQAYGLVKALFRYSPRFKKMMGEKAVEKWTEEFDNIMNWWRKKDKKKRTVTAALKWTEILKVLPIRKKEFDEAKKKYLRVKKEVERNKDKKRGSILRQALRTASNEFNKANMLYLIVGLYTLQPPRRLNTYTKMRVVDTIPVRNTVGKKGIQYLIIDPDTKKIESYYGVKNSVFVFQDYKTNDKYFQQRFALSRRALPSALGSYGKLRNIINQSLKDYVTKDGERRKWLIVNPNTEKPYKTLESTYQAAFRIPELIEENDGENVTANTLRHSYITYQTLDKKLLPQELRQLALLMLHSEKTQKESYLLLLNKYIFPEFQ